MNLGNNDLTTISQSNMQWMELLSIDTSGNPWQCDCENMFLKNVIIHTVNRSNNVFIVSCWTPMNLRDRDITFLNMNCGITQSSTGGQMDLDTDNAFLVVVIYLSLGKLPLSQTVPINSYNTAMTQSQDTFKLFWGSDSSTSVHCQSIPANTAETRPVLPYSGKRAKPILHIRCMFR